MIFPLSISVGIAIFLNFLLKLAY